MSPPLAIRFRADSAEQGLYSFTLFYAQTTEATFTTRARVATPFTATNDPDSSVTSDRTQGPHSAPVLPTSNMNVLSYHCQCQCNCKRVLANVLCIPAKCGILAYLPISRRFYTF